MDEKTFIVQAEYLESIQQELRECQERMNKINTLDTEPLIDEETILKIIIMAVALIFSITAMVISLFSKNDWLIFFAIAFSFTLLLVCGYWTGVYDSVYA